MTSRSISRPFGPWRRLARLTALAGAAFGLASCALLATPPAPTTLADRLAMFPQGSIPVERPVRIYWNAHAVPFVEAETDRDAAFALGLVHAHLRLGQIEVLRRISQGRISEIAGPIPPLADIDKTLRIVNFGKTSDEVYAAMPAETKAWLDAFVAGLNHYQATAPVLPHEYTILGIDRVPFRPQEILTIGRLASSDPTWFIWFRLFPYRDRPDWPQLWAQALREGGASAPSFKAGATTGLDTLGRILGSVGRVGSNSFAVGGAKTESGAAIIASDPHLGVQIPNAWMIAGVKSPSVQAVGFMIPGVPFVAVGRNMTIAWGGTAMRSTQADLINVSDLPESAFETRTEEIAVRFWFDDEAEVRESPFGPVLSDSPLVPKKEGESFAFKWIGHVPTDEMSAMIRVNRAPDWQGFRDALEGFSISPQNFVYADSSGNVGQVIATMVPKRSWEMPSDIIRPQSDAAAWETILTSKDLPSAFNPPEGYIASANNKPAENTPAPIGYFFSGDDRVTRAQELLASKPTISADDMKAFQRDVFQRSSAVLRDAIVARADALALTLTAAQRQTLDLVRGWDAQYTRESRGAVAFEALAATMVPLLFDDVENAILDTGGSTFFLYARELPNKPDATVRDALVQGLDRAQQSLAETPTWGDMHRLYVRHVFGQIPVLGERYAYGDRGWPGSTDTLWKSDNNLTAAQHRVNFGAQSRHVSDMGDPDANWFVLLGGNDGWFNSAQQLDQIALFERGEQIQVPLRIETVAATFPHRIDLAPGR